VATSIDDFKPFIQQDVQGCDIITLQNNLRYTLIDFCEETWILKKGITFTIDTEDLDEDMFDSIVFNTKGYFKYHRPFAIDGFKIDGLDWDLKYDEMINDTAYVENIKGSGYKIYEIFSLYSIRLAPFTTAQELFMRIVFKPLVAASYVDDRLFNDHVEAIAAGTKWRLLDLPGKAWTNHPAANRWERVYRSKISDARRRVGKNFTSKSGQVNPREFGFL
jgi:hypothetical protein